MIFLSDIRLSRALQVCAALCAVGFAGGAGAQRPGTHPDSTRADSLTLDSLRARLDRAEAAIDVLRAQLAGESESTVHTRSRLRVEISAQVLTNGFWDQGRVNNEDVPVVVLPPAPSAGGSAAPRAAALGMSVRQTRFGAATSVSDVLGGTFAGDVELDLFGGEQYSPGDRRLFPEPRLRTARARLLWSRTEVLAGSDSPLISMLNPVSLAAIGLPDFSAAGNLWNWLPQLRVTQRLAATAIGGTPVSWALQGAVMSPYSAQLAAAEPDAIDAGDRSQRPAVEARLRVRWGGVAEDGGATIADGLIGPRGGEIGVGMHRGWVAAAGGRPLESRAVSLDGHAVLFPGVELRGEGYAGRLLRGLGGGGIAQNFGAAPAGAPPGSLGPPVRDVAGWAQLNVQPYPLLLAGAGCGIDVADHRDRPARLQNTACEANVAWRPAQPVVIGLEVRRVATRYPAGKFGAAHVNLAFGFEL